MFSRQYFNIFDYKLQFMFKMLNEHCSQSPPPSIYVTSTFEIFDATPIKLRIVEIMKRIIKVLFKKSYFNFSFINIVEGNIN